MDDEDMGTGEAFGEDVLDLVQQGLVPLSLRSILVARLVCKHWQRSVGCLISKLHLPYEVWTGQISSASTGPSISAPAAGTYARSEYVTADSISDAEADDDAQDAGLQDDDDIWVPPPAVLFHVSAAAAAATAAAVAAAKERAAASQTKRRHDQLKDAQQQHELGRQENKRRRKNLQTPGQQHLEASADTAAALAAPATAAMTGDLTAVHNEHAVPVSRISSRADTSVVSSGNGSDASAAEQLPAAALEQQHLLLPETTGEPQSLPSSRPAETHAGQLQHLTSATDVAVKSSQIDPQPSAVEAQPVPAMQAATATSEAMNETAAETSFSRSSQQLGGRCKQRLQHPLQRLSCSFPFCTEVTMCCLNRSTSNPPVHQQSLITQSLGYISQVPKLRTLILQGSLPSGTWLQVVTAMHQQQQLQQKLRCLQLVGVYLPQPDVLESVVEMAGLRELVLHANDKSHGLQTAHLEALAAGTQLESLSLSVYQASGVNLRLNPLMQLTGLKSLEVVYKGIFKDQRPTLSPLASISNLSNLTSLSSAGLASPLLPQPNMSALINLCATGLTKRVSEAALKSLSQCLGLKQLKLEAGRRGIGAVAADQLHHLGAMKQLTSIGLSLSKGALKAGESSQQLMQLSALTELKVLTLSADHRPGFATEQLQALAAVWPKLETLRLGSFNPLQGLAGFGAFRGLVALSLKPGTGVGKMLFELGEGLEPLEKLQRLHLDFRGALRPEHIEAVVEACRIRLQHLSLNMRASSIGSKAIVDIAQLQCLTSLQLLNTTAATLAGPPAAAALRGMKGLQWLSIQAVELTAQQAPSELGGYIADGVEGLEALQELRVWLGSGVEGRQAHEQLQARVEGGLPCCRVRIMPEPERAAL